MPEAAGSRQLLNDEWNFAGPGVCSPALAEIAAQRAMFAKGILFLIALGRGGSAIDMKRKGLTSMFKC